MEVTKKVVPLHSQSTREHSSVGLEHLPYKQRVRGSTPFAPTTKTTYRNVGRLFFVLFCEVLCLYGEECGTLPLCVGCVGLSRCKHRAILPIPRRLRPTLLAVAIQFRLVFAKRCRTWIRGCGDRKILLLGLAPCAQRYPRQLALRLPFFVKLTRGRRRGEKERLEFARYPRMQKVVDCKALLFRETRG